MVWAPTRVNLLAPYSSSAETDCSIGVCEWCSRPQMPEILVKLVPPMNISARMWLIPACHSTAVQNTSQIRNQVIKRGRSGMQWQHSKTAFVDELCCGIRLLHGQPVARNEAC